MKNRKKIKINQSLSWLRLRIIKESKVSIILQCFRMKKGQKMFEMFEMWSSTCGPTCGPTLQRCSDDVGGSLGGGWSGPSPLAGPSLPPSQDEWTLMRECEDGATHIPPVCYPLKTFFNKMFFSYGADQSRAALLPVAGRKICPTTTATRWWWFEHNKVV